MSRIPRRPWDDDPYDEETWDYTPLDQEAPELKVEIEDRYEVAVLLGPDGEVISTLLDRPEVPFGFTAGDRTPSRWRRTQPDT